MEIGERPVKFLNGVLELDGFRDLMADYTIDHAMKNELIGSDGKFKELPPAKER